MPTPQEIRSNVKSIAAVPRVLLPDGPARDELVRRAQAGEDVYAYRVGIRAPYRWNIWLVDARHEAQDYVTRFNSR
jgi:hypothetical protein